MGRWLALAALLLCAAAARADETLGVNAFTGAANLPLLVGQHEGMFARRGLTVVLSHPKGSVDQIEGLVAGRYQVLFTALDNVAAYHDGHGEVDVGGPLDLVAFMGMDSGFLTLVAAPGTRDVAALEGKTVAVDALTTGFSFALQELLTRGGVARDAVKYITVGSSGARFKALRDGRAQAALLNMPLDMVAADKGFVRLETVAWTLGHYQATSAAVRESWGRTHRATLVAFLEAYRDAVRWLVVPQHEAAALAILHQEIPDLDAAALARVYVRLIDRHEGIERNLAIDPQGAAMVIALRARYGGGAGGDWRRYVDLSYLAAARSR